jgi:hypothetical protein
LADRRRTASAARRAAVVDCLAKLGGTLRLIGDDNRRMNRRQRV